MKKELNKEKTANKMNPVKLTDKELSKAAGGMRGRRGEAVVAAEEVLKARHR